MPRYVPLRTQLRKEVDEFLKLSGMAQTRFGLDAVNDTRFVVRLRAKGDKPIMSTTIDKVRQFIAKETAKIERKAKRVSSRKAA